MFVLLYLVVFLWTQSTVIHNFLSPSSSTEIVDSMGLERGFATTAMARDLPRIVNFGIIP